jgi:hypothetical protein
MVVNKTVTGRSLMVTILGFAVLQMLVQIFFFLHLGRGPKPLYNVAFFVSTVGIILVVVFGSIFIIDHLHYNMAPPQDLAKKLAQDEAIGQVGGEKTGACTDLGENHQIVIRDGKPNPVRVDAQLCDTLSFINEDNKSYDLVFGTKSEPKTYGGETGIALRKNYPTTITLNQKSSSVLFHDSIDPAMTGSFTVTAQE